MAKANKKTGGATAVEDAPGGGEGEGGKKKRGCLKKFFVVGVVLLVVLLWLLNGPGMRWGAEYGIGKALAGQGMTGSVNVGGTLWGGVRIESMDYSGGEMLPVLKVREAGVSYDLVGLIRDGGLKWLKEVRLKDAEVELVLAEKTDAEEVVEEEDEKTEAGEKPDFWELSGLVLDIENVNFKMTQGSQVTVVEGLTLKHDGQGEGRLAIGKLELPNGAGREGIGTEIHTTSESLTLGPLRIFDAVEVTSLTLHKEPGDGAMLSAKLGLAGGVVAAEATQELALKVELESGAIDVPELLALADVEGMGSGLVDVLEIDFAGDFGDPRTWRSAISLGVSDAEWAPAKVDRVALGAELKGGPAAVTLRAERSGAVVDVKATTDLGGVEEAAALADVGADVEATVRVAEVAEILKDYTAADAEPVPVSGSLDLKAKARVEAKKLAGATVTLASDTLEYGETGLGTVSVEADTEEGEVILATVGVVLDEATRVDVEGRYEVLAKAYSGKANVAADLAGKLRALLGEFGVEQLLEGKATVAWEGRGELEPGVHRGKADLALDGGKVDEGLEFDVKLDAAYDGTDVEIGEFTVVSDELRFRGGLKFADSVLEVSPIEVRDADREIVGGHVRVPLDLETVKSAGEFFAQPGELDVALKSESLPLASLMRLAGVEPPVTGVLDFDIEVAGPPRALAGKGSLAVVGVGPVEEGEVKVPPADVELGFLIGDAKLDVSGAVKHPQLNPLEVKAGLPFLPEAWATGERKVIDEDLVASVKMAPSDLAFVKGYAAVIEVIDGSLGIDVDVAGQVGAPVVTGTAGFELAEVRMANPNIPGVKDAVVNLRFAERVVEVNEFRAVVAGGELGLEGKVGLPPEGGGPEFDLRLTGKETLVTRNDMLSVRMNIDLALRGPYEAAALTGKLGVTESLFFKNFDLLPVRLPRRSKSLLPEVERAPSAPMPRSIEVGVEAEPFNNWTVDVKLLTDDPFLVRSNLAETDVSIDLRVSGKLEKPVPDGKIWLEEGEVKLPFSKILVQQGEVVFNEETGFNPALEFRVTAEASEYNITGYIYNRALDPKWVLTSNPPLPQEDILTLVGTGSTREALTGSGQGDLAKMAGKYVFSAIRREKAVESREPTFFDEIADRSKIEIEGVDMKTGEVTMGGQIRLWRELYLNGKFGQEGSYRAMLKYLFKFK